MAFLYGGNPEQSIPQFEAGIRLSPRSPVLWAHWTMLGLAYISLGKFEEAAASFESAIEQPNAAYMAFAYAAAALTHLDRIDEGRAMLAEVKLRRPDFAVDAFENTIRLYGKNSWAEQIISGLHKADLST